MILDSATDQWDVRVTVNGDTRRAMSAYSYFGNSQPPKGFVVALLGEDRSEFLVFRDGGRDWLEFGGTIPIANAIRRMNGIGRLAVEANRPVLRMK